jgi:hypothetical protein
VRLFFGLNTPNGMEARGRLPQVFQNMDEIQDPGRIRTIPTNQAEDEIELLLASINQDRPRALLFRITPQSSVKEVLDLIFLLPFRTGPDPLGRGSLTDRFLLIGAALVSLDGIDGHNGSHAFALALFLGIKPGARAAHRLFCSFARGSSKVFLAYGNPLLIDAHRQKIRHLEDLLSLSDRIERIRILSTDNRNLLKWSFGDLPPRRLVDIG